jgi:hypothetical protein
MTSTSHPLFEHTEGNHLNPWEWEGSAYEQRKLTLMGACLPETRYRSAFEAGRSIGGVTELLAVRCDRLLWSDITPSPQSRRGPHLALTGDTRVGDHSISHQWPAGIFDLVVLNEVAVHFDERDLGRVIACVLSSTGSGGHVVGVHARGPTTQALSAVRSHAIIARSQGLVSAVHHEEEEFLLDIWERW